MSLRTVTMASGVVGGLCWAARMVLDLAGTHDGAAVDVLRWAGLALVGIALAALGAGLVGREPWLRVVVAVAFPLLVWSVLEVLHPAGNPAVIDGVFGLVVVADLPAVARPRPRWPAAHGSWRARPLTTPTRRPQVGAGDQAVGQPFRGVRNAGGRSVVLPRGTRGRKARRGSFDRQAGDDQPAHLAARPAGHRRRRRHERLCHRAFPPAGPQGIEVDIFTRATTSALPHGGRGLRRRAGAPRHRRTVRGVGQG